MAIGTTAAILGGASVLGSVLGASSAKKAANVQADASREGLALQREMFQQGREDLAPWREAGGESLGMLMSGIRDGSLTEGPNPENFRTDPGYQFRLGEGMRAVEGSAAARGILQSGGTLKGINRYAQGVADQGYNDWFNRERAVQGDRYNRIAGVAGTGQAAVTTGVQQGQNFGNAGAQSLANIGQARASGYAGQNQAIQGGLGNLMSLYTMGGFGK